MLKLAIIVGTRPEIIRLSATITLAKKYFNVVLIHTGQNYDKNLNEIFFKDLNIDNPDHYLNCVTDNIGRTIGDIISKSYDLLIDIKPDCLLVLGDTNSCLCCYNAKRLKIPIFHIEAGNRCFDPNVPEEINRKIIDHLADVNICYMEHARRNLLKENYNSQYIFVVGSPIKEVFKNIEYRIDQSNILNVYKLMPNEYFVWSSHRESNTDNLDNFLKIIHCINSLASKYKKKIIFSVHPRTNKKIIENNIIFNDNVILCEPFGILDYYYLQKKSLCVISDSGTLTEEANILNFRAVLLRTSTEHPEGIDNGSIIIGNIEWSILEQSINMCISLNKNNNIIADYSCDNFSEKIVKIILGYFSIVNKFIWMK